MTGVLTSTLARERDAQRARRNRLFNSPSPEPKQPPRERPISPFSPKRRAVQIINAIERKHRLFTAPIVEVDDEGMAVAISSLFSPQWKTIIREVAAKHHVTPNDLVSPRRDRPTVHARHEAFYRCKLETVMSLPAIGRRFGGRDHTTVLHGIRMHMERAGITPLVVDRGNEPDHIGDRHSTEEAINA